MAESKNYMLKGNQCIDDIVSEIKKDSDALNEK